jgi:hypothetical protein
MVQIFMQCYVGKFNLLTQLNLWLYPSKLTLILFHECDVYLAVFLALAQNTMLDYFIGPGWRFSFIVELADLC